MASNISRETDPLIALSDLVGEKIEEDTEQLVKLLTLDVTEGHANIPIVAIEGMGGIGKTTLAKKVYNDPTIQQNFEHLIWVCVSKEIKQVDLVKNVIRVVGGDCGAAEKKSELVPMLQQLIQGKKFFLVLDDIWAESEQVWHDHLRVPMSSGAPGSRVLITRRDGEVAMRMRAIHTHKVNGLTDEDGWSLLIKQVASNGVENEFQDLKDIGMQIVKKCNGLPLAIKSIGGVLCTKGDWLTVLRSNVWSMDGLPGDVHHVFYLSYEDLSPPLKQCFIFCFLFPEDFELSKKDLIFMWLAEGFLQDKDNFWELGNEYYTELLWRNLLEVTGSTVDQVQCKMHDLLWSFARHLGKDENCVLWEGHVLSRYEGSLKVRRLSIEGSKVNTKVIKNEKELRTILLRDKVEVALGDLCKVFSNLRILDLNWSNFSSLPDSFCDLVHLRYLDVSGSNITNLPNSIRNLKYLVYLNIEFCYDLSHVPCSIINLRELKLLNTYYSGVKAIPSGLYKLDKLVEL
ncbi:putative disease resistance protein RGA3 [Carex rostrata]